ncbi:MAG: hypothetical protein OXB94_05265 [Nitrospira sp.]|nr:hypothetical protein [Nitrospira sp.]
MPSGPTSSNFDRRPSSLAADFLVVVEWDTNYDFPKRVVYVYVEVTHERAVASIPDRVEVVARGTIQRIGSTSLAIGKATILPVRQR